MRRQPSLNPARLAMLLLTLLAALGSSGLASACSCSNPDRASAFNIADEVVGGEVTGSQKRGAHTYSVFAVGKRWKGGDATHLLLRSDGPCGFTFETGQTYLVYAREISDGTLHVSQCSGTQLFGKNQALLRQLESLQQ